MRRLNRLFPTTAFLFGMGMATAQTSYGPYLPDSGADKVVVIEANGYHRITAGNNNTWQSVSDPEASHFTAMSALPDIDERNNTGYIGLSPALHYDIDFASPGTYYAIVLGRSPNGAGDSVHLGLNGVEVSTADRIGSFSGSYEWEEDTYDSVRAELQIPSAGIHSLDLWMREDGVVIDKILLTSNTNFFPHGHGPVASQQTGTPPGEAAPELRIESAFVENGLFYGSFTPRPGVDRYRIRKGGQPDSANPEDMEAGLDGFHLVTATTNIGPGFISVETVPVESNLIHAATLAKRITFGPTPALVDHLIYAADPAAAAQTFLDQQLSPETLTESADSNPEILALETRLAEGAGSVNDLQAWHCLRAVHADRQFLELLLQFIDNHFVTYVWKTRDWLRDQGLDSTEAQAVAAQLEFREMQLWRNVLLNPNGTFYDLLKVSIESPPMIIFLDTVENEKSAPNENYSRELFELFCMGVDNGYEQNDIEIMSPAWTGWRVGEVDVEHVGNPFAPLPASNHLVSAESDWLYRKGNSPISNDWHTTGYVTDTNWVSGTASIGYGDNDDNTELTDMRYNYSTVFLRKWVDVPDPQVFTNATMSHWIDDGAVIYINGQEIFRMNYDPAGVPTESVTADNTVGNATRLTTTLTNLTSVLQPGSNLIAVASMNTSLTSSDLTFDMEILQGLPPTWGFKFDAASYAETNKVLFPGKLVDGRFGSFGGGTPYALNLPMRVDTNGIQDGYDIINHLANLPYTQEFLIVKLCQLLIHENFAYPYYYNIESGSSPEQELIESCMTAWNTTAGDGRKGNLRLVLRAILESDLFRSQAAAQQKVKTPLEFTVSAIRALRADVGGTPTASTDGYDLNIPIQRMGMNLFANFSPDGYPEVGNEWIDTGTLLTRISFIQNLLRRSDDPDKSTDYGSGGIDNLSDPVALLQDAVSSGDLTNDQVVSSHFLTLFFPGSGLDNLHQEFTECLFLLNSDASGVANSSPFSGLSPGSQIYDERVRSMVALLLSSPRFQEQ